MTNRRNRSLYGNSVPFLLCFILTFQLESAAVGAAQSSCYVTYDIDPDTYAIKGDLQIGAFIRAKDCPNNDVCAGGKSSCGKWSYFLQRIEGLVYGIRLVNQNKTLLPHVSLGLVMVDGCDSVLSSLTQSLTFLRRTTYTGTGDCASVRSERSVTSSKSHTGKMEVVPYYDVIGVLGPSTSPLTIPVASLYSAAQIPLLSYMASSDQLSDEIYNYFLRVVPADKIQVKAMLQFINDQGWNYISVVYHGMVGENGFEQIRKLSSSYDICIATHHSMRSSSDYGDIVSQLLQNPNARVVVVFSRDIEVKRLFNEIRRVNALGHFIWIGSDTVADRDYLFQEYNDVIVGGITFMFLTRPVKGFYEYFGGLSPENSPNPFFKGFWEKARDCSFENSTCNEEGTIGSDWDVIYSAQISLEIDCIFTFAHAIDKLLQDICPNATGKDVRGCIKGNTLLKYLLKTSFEGFSNWIEFYANGDANGKYQIRQIVYSSVGSSNYSTHNIHEKHKDLKLPIKEIEIGMYTDSSARVEYSSNSLVWEHMLNPDEDEAYANHEWHHEPHDHRHNYTPVSFCSPPCPDGEFKVVSKGEPPCCWKCKPCLANQRFVEGKDHHCEKCALLTWPDPSTGFRNCSRIEPTYPSILDVYPFIYRCIGGIGVAMTLLTFVFYVNYGSERLIMAAGQALTFLKLAAILTGYVTVIILHDWIPTTDICKLVYVLFWLSFTGLYAPLLIQSINIYGAFNEDGDMSPNAQLYFSGILIGFQTIACIVISHLPTGWIVSIQPDPTEKLVREICDYDNVGTGLTLSLCYNLGMVVLCSFYAFKTSRLENNFHESLFTLLGLIITLITWLVFISIYIYDNSVLSQDTLLSLTLMLNHSWALAFFFLPKIYAVSCLQYRDVNVDDALFEVEKKNSFESVATYSSGIGIGTEREGRENLTDTELLYR